jgi:hypothetical protein
VPEKADIFAHARGAPEKAELAAHAGAGKELSSASHASSDTASTTVTPADGNRPSLPEAEAKSPIIGSTADGRPTEKLLTPAGESSGVNHQTIDTADTHAAEHGPHGWHHDSGASLDAIQNFEADQLLGRARHAEPGITHSIRDIAGRLETGQLIGEEFRLKTENSLKEKLATSIFDHPDRTLAKHLADIKDAVRYTIQSAETSYVRDVVQALSELTTKGYECVKFKNFWGGGGYQGINSFWVDPRSGQIFELQFHTVDSFDAKMTTHGLYEEARLSSTPPLRRAELESMQQQIFDSVAQPRDASGLAIQTREGPK